jgi:hypothetical protein
LAAPRAAHRKPRLPRRPCGLVPHRLEVRAAGSPPRRLLGCVPHLRTASYRRRVLPGGPSPAPLRTQADVRRRTRALMSGVPSPSPGYKRPHDVQIAHAAAQADRPTCAPHRGAPSSGPFRRSPPPSRSSTRPLQHPCVARASSHTGGPPEQGPPRPCSLHAAGRPAAGAPPPIRGHKPVVGKPLFLLHPFPGQIFHRNGPIPASRAAIHA